MTERRVDRKRVPWDLRVAVSAEVRRLLSMRDAKSGEWSYTQESLGEAMGISQEAVRKAQHPDGVIPRVKDGVLRLTEMSVEELLEYHRPLIEQARQELPAPKRYAASAARQAADLWPEVKELAIEELIELHGLPYREAKAAVLGVAGWDWGEQGPSPRRWAAIALAAREADAAPPSRSGVGRLERAPDEHRKQLKPGTGRRR